MRDESPDLCAFVNKVGGCSLELHSEYGGPSCEHARSCRGAMIRPPLIFALALLPPWRALLAGDLFKQPQHHDFYFRQPPRSFYHRILGMRRWSKVYFITDAAVEAHLHPNYKYFRDAPKSDPRFVFSNARMVDDIKAMFCSRYLVMAGSTMSWLMVDLSPFIEEYYSPYSPYCSSLVDFAPLQSGGFTSFRAWARWSFTALESGPPGPSPNLKNSTYFEFPGFDITPRRKYFKYFFVPDMDNWDKVDEAWKREWDVRITSDSVGVKGPLYYSCPHAFRERGSAG